MGIKINLLNLRLRNFKGIKNFDLDIKGNDVRIYGDNGAGKTTLFDAFCWLLFNKDSKGQSDFEIKTLDEFGNVKHKLEHEVEGILSVNGNILTLRKIFYEKWTKKKGQTTEEFTGHSTDYFIDEIPAKKKEYDSKISELVDESIFKLVTNPAYFNETLKWEDRRKILLEVVGGIDDLEIIKANENLAELTEILTNRTIEEHKKVVKAKQTKINKELKAIPTRIDEVVRNMFDIEGLDEDEIKSQIDKLKEDKKKIEENIATFSSDTEMIKKKGELATVEAKIEEAKRKHRSNYTDDITKKEGSFFEIKSKLQEFNYENKNKLREIGRKESKIENLKTRTDELREKWHGINKEKFEQDNVCPTCGQLLPDNQIEEAENSFNLLKSEKLTHITEQGKAIKLEIETLQNEIKNLTIEAEEIEEEYIKQKEFSAKLSLEIENLKLDSMEYTLCKTYRELYDRKQQIETEFEKLKETQNNSDILANLKNKGLEIDREIQGFNMDLLKIENNKKAQARIQELEEQERKLSAEFEDLERQLSLTEVFTRSKIELLDEKLNKHFKLARFKLFEEQINGGLKDICETLYKGVPYNSNLNNGAKINVGIDIINTLSKHYDFYAPIFVDNSESITKLIDTESQVIKLVVSEPDKTLRVEECK